MHSIDSALKNASPLESPESQEKSPQGMKAMQTLWLRLGEIYGHKWTSAYGDRANTGAGLTWAKGLSGLTARQLADGLSSCITSADPWPPTLPQFRAMCLAIPSLEVVRAELHAKGRETQASTPFAILVWQRIDGFTYWQADGRVAAGMLKAAYEGAREHVMAGGDLPEARVALPPPDGISERLAERVAYIRQQHHLGAYGEGTEAKREMDQLIAKAEDDYLRNGQ